jgi:anti-anti-sigma regulatory factor
MNDDRPLVIRLLDAEWDLTTCDRLEAELLPTLDRPNVIIDMSRVTFLDSSCLRKLFKMHQERVITRGFEPASLIVTASNIRRLLAIVGFDEHWPVFETPEKALAAAADVVRKKSAVRPGLLRDTVQGALDG